MKKALFFTLLISINCFLYAHKTEVSDDDDTRGLQELLSIDKKSPKPVTLLSRGVHLIKGAGAGILSLLCAYACMKGGDKRGYEAITDPHNTFMRKACLASASVYSLLMAAELGGYSLINFQEAVLGMDDE